MTKIKQDKEKSYYEVAMLKQRLLQNFLPEPLHSLQLPLPSSTSASINTISDPTSRHNLLEQYTKIIKQTKSEMMTLYITIAEVKMRECQFQFDHDILQMRPNQRLTTIDRCLSELMIAIVERRFKNIDERLKYLYNLKLRFLNQKKA